METLIIPCFTEESEEVMIKPQDNSSQVCDVLNLGHYMWAYCPSDVVDDYLKSLYNALPTAVLDLITVEQFTRMATQVHSDISDEYQGREGDRLSLGKILPSSWDINRAIGLCKNEETHPQILEEAQALLLRASDMFYKFHNHDPESAPGRYCLNRATELAEIAKMKEAVVLRV